MQLKREKGKLYICLCLAILQPKFSSTIHVYKECFWPFLKNCSLFIVQLHNCSPSIVVIVIDRRLIVHKPEYFSSFLHNYLHIYHSLTNCEGRVNRDLTFYLVLILVQGYHKCIITILSVCLLSVESISPKRSHNSGASSSIFDAISSI